jgi:hypothetical protein
MIFMVCFLQLLLFGWLRLADSKLLRCYAVSIGKELPHSDCITLNRKQLRPFETSASRQRITSQKTWIFSNTAVRNSDLQRDLQKAMRKLQELQMLRFNIKFGMHLRFRPIPPIYMSQFSAAKIIPVAKTCTVVIRWQCNQARLFSL